MTYVLHYAPDNASLIVRLVLEELEAPYRTVLVDRAARAQEGAAYRSTNPTGLIPALETRDGVIFETAAILLWLADTRVDMTPNAPDPGRGSLLSWLFFTANTLHPMLRMTFYPEKYVCSDPDAQSALRQRLTTLHPVDMSLPRALALLEGLYASRPETLRRKAPIILDYYVCVLLRWCQIYPAGATAWFDFAPYPALRALAQRLETRPATMAAIRAEGLGPTPFSSASLPMPPEGCAL
jgi:glutathione S-transferase